MLPRLSMREKFAQRKFMDGKPQSNQGICLHKHRGLALLLLAVGFLAAGLTLPDFGQLDRPAAPATILEMILAPVFLLSATILFLKAHCNTERIIFGLLIFLFTLKLLARVPLFSSKFLLILSRISGPAVWTAVAITAGIVLLSRRRPVH